MNKKILHIDMDAYFASIEQRDNPELRGKAIAVGGSGRRGVVAAASYEARKFGVRSAMAGMTAKKLCPELIFVKGNHQIYSEESKKIMSIFKDYSDLIEPMSLDEAYIDVTEYCENNNISAYKVAKEIKLKIKEKTQLTASAGVSFVKFLAKIASDFKKPDGLYVIQPKDAKEFIKTLPIQKVPGIGKVTAEKMNSMGIYLCSDIIKNDISFMIHNFGKSGAYFYNLLNLNVDNPVRTHRIRKSLGAERTFFEDISDIEIMKEKLKNISEKVSNSLIKKNISGKTITLKIKYNDFNVTTRSKTLHQYFNDYDTIYNLSNELLFIPVKPFKPVRLLGISISNLNTVKILSNTIQLRLDL